MTFANNALDRHYHHNFDKFPGSFSLISPSENVSRAVIFVHGFGGDACETWSDFHSLIDDLEEIEKWSAATDFFFFDYRAVWERIDSSVERVLTFIRAIIPTPDSRLFRIDINPVLADQVLGGSFVSALPAERSYEKAILIGHSEGAVVLRKAILEAHAEGRSLSWGMSILGARLPLFSPALFGYMPTGLLGILAPFPGIGAVINSVLNASAAYQDLNDLYMLLAPLQHDTEKLAESTTYQAFRAHILWSREDHIVKQGRYKCDTREFVDGRTHITICKPDRDYTLPLIIVSMEH